MQTYLILYETAPPVNVTDLFSCSKALSDPMEQNTIPDLLTIKLSFMQFQASIPFVSNSLIVAGYKVYDVRNSIGNERKNRSPFHLKLIFLIPNPHNVMFVQTARHFIHNYVVTQIQCLLIEIFIKCTKDVKELGWMSHRVIRF